MSKKLDKKNGPILDKNTSENNSELEELQDMKYCSSCRKKYLLGNFCATDNTLCIFCAQLAEQEVMDEQEEIDKFEEERNQYLADCGEDF